MHIHIHNHTVIYVLSKLYILTHTYAYYAVCKLVPAHISTYTSKYMYTDVCIFICKWACMHRSHSFSLLVLQFRDGQIYLPDAPRWPRHDFLPAPHPFASPSADSSGRTSPSLAWSPLCHLPLQLHRLETHSLLDTAPFLSHGAQWQPCHLHDQDLHSQCKQEGWETEVLPILKQEGGLRGREGKIGGTLPCFVRWHQHQATPKWDYMGED